MPLGPHTVGHRLFPTRTSSFSMPASSLRVPHPKERAARLSAHPQDMFLVGRDLASQHFPKLSSCSRVTLKLWRDQNHQSEARPTVQEPLLQVATGPHVWAMLWQHITPFWTGTAFTKSAECLPLRNGLDFNSAFRKFDCEAFKTTITINTSQPVL